MAKSREREEAHDKTIEDSFPASDPPASSGDNRSSRQT